MVGDSIVAIISSPQVEITAPLDSPGPPPKGINYRSPLSISLFWIILLELQRIFGVADYRPSLHLLSLVWSPHGVRQAVLWGVIAHFIEAKCIGWSNLPYFSLNENGNGKFNFKMSRRQKTPCTPHFRSDIRLWTGFLGRPFFCLFFLFPPATFSSLRWRSSSSPRNISKLLYFFIWTRIIFDKAHLASPFPADPHEFLFSSVLFSISPGMFHFSFVFPDPPALATLDGSLFGYCVLITLGDGARDGCCILRYRRKGAGSIPWTFPYMWGAWAPIVSMFIAVAVMCFFSPLGEVRSFSVSIWSSLDKTSLVVATCFYSRLYCGVMCPPNALQFRCAISVFFFLFLFRWVCFPFSGGPLCLALGGTYFPFCVRKLPLFFSVSFPSLLLFFSCLWLHFFAFASILS